MSREQDTTGTRSKSLLESFLRKGPSFYTSPSRLFNMLEDEAARSGFNFNMPLALEHWWELARVGGVAILGDTNGNRAAFPSYVVTKRGIGILERGELSPHDQGRYVIALRKRVSAPDAIAMSYLEEAIGAWKAQLHRASAVMLGCACERLILVLAEFIRSSNEHPYTKTLEKMLSAPRPPGIADIFTQVRDALIAAAEDRRLPGDLGKDIIDRRLSSVFEHVRLLRNTSGHPTGDEVTSEEAESGLLLFPGFHELTSRVLSELKPKAVTT